jgi:hypothetical protein
MSFTFDFGFETKAAPKEKAFAAFLFACLGEETDLGKLPGPLAIADASRYVEFFEMQVGLSPLDMGVYSEVVGGPSPVEVASERAAELLGKNVFPIIVGENRALTEKVCRNPLVALWGKIGRMETEESAVFNRRGAVLAGVRAATSRAFRAIPSQVTILTAHALSSAPGVLSEALAGFREPVHLAIDFDVLSPGAAQTIRSLEPGGLSWYELLGAIEKVFEHPGVAAVTLVGTANIRPQSAAALLGAQLLVCLSGIKAASKHAQ